MTEEKKTAAEALPPIDLALLQNEADFTAFTGCLPADLAQAGQGGLLNILGAAVGGVPAGVIVFQVLGNTLVLPWLYVAPAFRRQYIASSLLGEVLDFLETDYFDGSIEALCIEYSDDAEGLWGFLEAAGFEQAASGEVALGAKLEALPRCDFMAKAPALPAGVSMQPLADLSEVHLRSLGATLLREGAEYTGLPLTADNFLMELSFAAWAGGEPVGCVALSAQGESDLLLSIFYTAKASPSVPMTLLHAAGKAALAARGTQGRVLIPLLTDSSRRLAERLLGDEAEQAAQLIEARLPLLLDADEDEDEESA